MKTVTLQVEGMSCSHCQNAVQKAIKSLKGVDEVKVSLADKTAVVDFDESVVSIENIKAAIEDEGYSVV